ncbi:hypothetical protein BABINDRAFT_158944 [Babjeviella inositovora NRRL Y-12698]|uniref:Uncharacterized protein n=1 Tax=Babjeviella inositovora NRRL Y-12698 TaxID=984486 RepID=A0A1E3QXQ2_9ASCO|nr:uncharacterized protein BABINDRAFT_158944 [Babjeviella inositovora NRRL Y-12698]ODQ82324.1 hypothetical protein BABINDRAFT_158944 [Babjeviella inositovora NRRL Y-12698]
MHFALLLNDFRDSQITLENSDGCTNQYLTRSENETTESPEEVFTPHDEFELDPRIADGGEVHLEMFLPEYYMTDHENVNPMDSLEIFNPERELKMIDSILAELQGTKSETTNKAGERKRHDLPFENNGLWRGPIDNQYNHLPSDENNPFPLPYMIMPKIVDGYHLETFSTDEELEHTSGLSLSPIKRFNQLADIEWNTKRDTDAYGDGNIPKGTDCLTGRFSLEIQSFSSENNLFENPSSYLKGLEGMEDDCPTFLMSEI